MRGLARSRLRFTVGGCARACAVMALALGPGRHLTACTSVHSTAFRTSETVYAPNHGRVYVSGTRDPAGGTEIGSVQATGFATIEDLIPELVARTAQLGGNYARIDQVVTRYEVQVRPYAYGYNCGSARFPMRCNSTSYRPEEIATTRVLGRAFRVPEPAP